MLDISVFDFDDDVVRTCVLDGEYWFVAKDVCRILDISSHRDAVSRLDEDERGSVVVDTRGGPQQMTTVSESGLFSLIFTSRKDTAKRFRKWVTSEVLPALRRDGSYTLPGGSADAMLNQRDEAMWLAKVREARLLGGTQAALKMWQASPLPPLQMDTPAKDEQEDTILLFLKDCIEVTGRHDHWIAAGDLVAMFLTWLEDTDHPPVGRRAASLRFAALASRYRDPETGKRFSREKSYSTGYRGLRLREDAEG